MKDKNEIMIHHKEKFASYLLAEFLKPTFIQKNMIVCIGTDKCIGDCLGPLVGTLLMKRNISLPVYGTLNYPIHALNLEENLTSIKKAHPFHKIIAIDACLGEREHVGNIQIRHKPIYPGKGVGKKLPSIGDISIVGIVDAINNYNGLSLHTIRLSLIMEMAEIIVNSILIAKK